MRRRVDEAAVAAADLDFQETGLSRLEWSALTSCVRAGISVGPAVDALASVGRDALCRAWGVDKSMWHAESASWFNRYNRTWADRIDALNSEPVP